MAFKQAPPYGTRSIPFDYYSPKFNTCGRQIELAGWPEDKRIEEFVFNMDHSVGGDTSDGWTLA